MFKKKRYLKKDSSTEWWKKICVEDRYWCRWEHTCTSGERRATGQMNKERSHALKLCFIVVNQIHLEWNKYSKWIATKLVYQRKPINTAIYEKFVCYNHKTKYTDWCPIPNDGGWGICLRMWKPVKEIALKILNNGRMYITRSIITRFFPMDPDDRVIMESQCRITFEQFLMC